MSYQDPRDPYDPRTRRFDSGYPESRAYSETGRYAEPTDYHNTAYPPGRGQGSRGVKSRLGPDINPVLFVGGVVMSGVVTGLAAWLVGWLIRAIVERVNEAGKFGVWNPMARDEIWFAVVGFLCALAAGALWYVLHLVTPSPRQFYQWIVGLLIAAAVVVPLLLSQEISVGITTAVMHLVIGVPLLLLIPTMGTKSIERR